MGQFIRLKPEHKTIYNQYIENNFYENLYLNLDFNKDFKYSPYDKKNGHFYGYFEKDLLLGVFVFSNNSILHLSYVDDSVLKKLDLLRAIKKYKPKIIKGKKESIEKVVKVFENSIINYKVNDYDIMQHSGIEEFSSGKSCHVTPQLLNKSFDFLVNVERSFERNPKLLNDIKTKLIKKYENNEYFAFQENERIISQGILENKGKNFIVIGSIYTDEKKRKRGYGKRIVQLLINEVINRGKIPLLLVKKENSVAINLYKQLGFQKKADFQIVELKII
ncbi:MAG TPA: GNAT family N-acetyltransferase [Clostridia bacterium]|nr:GNAT family N-acetyltransferase [Clostridia bacterium]